VSAYVGPNSRGGIPSRDCTEGDDAESLSSDPSREYVSTYVGPNSRGGSPTRVCAGGDDAESLSSEFSREYVSAYVAPNSRGGSPVRVCAGGDDAKSLSSDPSREYVSAYVGPNSEWRNEGRSCFKPGGMNNLSPEPEDRSHGLHDNQFDEDESVTSAHGLLYDPSTESAPPQPCYHEDVKAIRNSTSAMVGEARDLGSTKRGPQRRGAVGGQRGEHSAEVLLYASDEGAEVDAKCSGSMPAASRPFHGAIRDGG